MPGYNTEADYENAIIELFRNDLGYEYVYGPDVERDFNSPLYDSVLEESLYRLNKGLPADAINDALFKLRNFENGELVQKNAVFMDYLQNGIEVRFFDKGEQRSARVKLADFETPENNSFIVANQWTFIENSNKRPDILLFLIGSSYHTACVAVDQLRAQGAAALPGTAEVKKHPRDHQNNSGEQ